MGYRVKDQMSPRIYPWWLILVGFIFGVIVTLVITASHPQQGVVYQQPYDNRDILAQATQFVREATLNAQNFERVFPTPDRLDPLLQQATAMVVQATQTAVSR